MFATNPRRHILPSRRPLRIEENGPCRDRAGVALTSSWNTDDAFRGFEVTAPTLRKDIRPMVREEMVGRVLDAIRRNGLMMFTDPRLPSVVSILAEAPVRGSWFSHPAAQDIYGVGLRLEDSPDLIALPLLRGQVTLVHRRLWPELFSVATSGEPWQTRGLTRAQTRLLHLVAARKR